MRVAKYEAAASVFVAAGLAVLTNTSEAATGGRMTSAGSVTLSSLVSANGADGLSNPEIRLSTEAADNATAPPAGQGKKVDGARVAPAGPEAKLTFAGLNHRNQRLANGGNQFSLEPPDQALCVGPQYVLEGTNDVLRSVVAKSLLAGTAVIR